jgi:hypothetical protein
MLLLKISQYMSRLFPEYLEYKPSFTRILIGKETEDPRDPIKYIMGGIEYNYDHYGLESSDFLDAGTYYIYIELDFNTDTINTFGLSVLAYEFSIKEVDHSCNRYFLEDCISNYAKYHIKESRSK